MTERERNARGGIAPAGLVILGLLGGDCVLYLAATSVNEVVTVAGVLVLAAAAAGGAGLVMLQPNQERLGAAGSTLSRRA